MVRAVNAAAQAVRAARGPIMEVPMIWIEARNRQTGGVEGVGFWAGGETVAVTLIDLWSRASLTRTFIGAGSLLSIGAPVIEPGFSVRPMSARFSGVSAEVELAVRGYDLRGARVSIWLREHDPSTHKQIGVAPVFRGWIDRIDWRRPEPGGDAEISVEMVSSARTLSITSPAQRSDAFYTARGSRIMRYAAQPGVELFWGGKDARQ
jgi:hypothetical protein